MAEEQAAHHLLNVLEERNLNVDLDRILAAFEDDATNREVAQWVGEYLHEETLLTKEELELYQTLKKKGMLHQYEAEDEPTRPVLDHELSSAIDALQSSTAAIEEQCKVLEAQRDALMALKALDKPNLDAEHLRNERRRKGHQEKARLDANIEDIATSIQDQLGDARRDIEADKANLKSYLAERLASDDQILSRLPGIVSQIIAEPEVHEDEKSIEQWCEAIISFRTAEAKARVDTVYLNSLKEVSPDDAPDVPEAGLQEQKAALQAELEELHSEIASVATLVVGHEIRKPIMDMKERRDRDRIQARNSWLRYVLSTLSYMGKRLDTVASHTRDIDGFHQAFTRVNEAAVKRIPNFHAEAPVSARKRAISTPKAAFSPMVKLKPPQSLDLPNALQDALRHASVSFNQDSVDALGESLAKTRIEREQKLQEHFAAASSSTHDRLAERLGRADGELRAVLAAVYEHTPFQRISLANPRVEGELRKMERELQESDDKLLEAEANELSLSDPRVRAFIAKYGR